MFKSNPVYIIQYKENKRVTIQEFMMNNMSVYGFRQLTNKFLNGLNRIVNMKNYLIHTIMQTINNIMSNPPAPAPI